MHSLNYRRSGCDTVCMMLLSCLSQSAVRNKIFGLGVEFECVNLFHCILLLVFNTNTFIHEGKLPSSDLLADLVSILNRISFIKLQQFHPFLQNILVFEEKFLFLIDALSVADFDAEACLHFKDAFDC